MYGDLYSRSRALWRMTTAPVKRVIAAVRDAPRLPRWQRALATATAGVLLVGLLWLAPWQERQEAPGPVPPPLPAQEDAGAGWEAAPPALPTAPPAASDATADEPRHLSTTAEESTEELDTQAMQELLARLELSRSSPAERLDTRAMDDLLARLDAGDRKSPPAAPRPGAAKRKQTRSMSKTTADPRTPRVTSSPQQFDPALVSPAPGLSQFDPRPPGRHESEASRPGL